MSFINIFQKYKAEVLTPHYSYNLKINLKEDVQLLVSTIYSLLASKQETMKKFIEKNLNIGFIQPTFSLYSNLVLFIKNNDRLLHLCVDFHSINCITKKNYYLILLISNLLDLAKPRYILR